MEESQPVKVRLGCFGCLLDIVGLIGVLWVLGHITEVTNAIARFFGN